MNQTFINRILDAALYYLFCALLGTGLLIEYRLLPPHGQSFLGGGLEFWGNVHLWLGFAMAVAVFVHLAMKWTWLCKVAAKSHLRLLALGIAGGVLVVAAFLLIPMSRS